jgi:CRISPR-associated exonuclease Cas4
MDDANLIMISALQHYLYCPRQCALIHIEQMWAENKRTAEGRLLHERADKPLIEKRRGVRTVTAMPLLNLELGITGVADLVEFHEGERGEYIFPVEYKRGRPKGHRADEVQLCAQALCLESMLNNSVAAGALFYGETRRRQDVIFDEELRNLTIDTVRSTAAMIESRQTPLASYEAKRCDGCSLMDLCQPRWLARSHSVASWVRDQLED